MFLLKIFLVFFSTWLQLTSNSQATAAIAGCVTPLGDRGQCVSLKDCPEILSIFRKLPTQQATQYSNVLKNICGNHVTHDNYPMLCCTQPRMTNMVNNDFGTTEIPKDTSKSVNNDDSDFTKILTQRKLCRGPYQERGICKSLQDCSVLLDSLIQDPRNETLKDYLRLSHKNCDDVGTEVCCPPSIMSPRGSNPTDGNSMPSGLPSERDGCGQTIGEMTKIVGGSDSHIGAFPWLVLLGYNPYSLNPFRCGGSLITARHVLTAGHCIRKDLSFVRLGEFDLSIENETAYVEVPIERSVRHENYLTNAQRFDIAMIYLERSVQFSDLIRPICLPVSSQLRTKSYVSYSPFVAGWGRTQEQGSPSHILQELQIMVYNNSVCRQNFQRLKGYLPDENFDDAIVCAGFLSGGKDTCHGDSGGPLMIPEPYKGVTHYYLLGIVSYGIGCAHPGIPGIYTSAQYFMDWILQKINEA